MENDDKAIGLVFSRRDALKLLGVVGAALLASCAAPNGTSTVIPVTGVTQQSPAITVTTPYFKGCWHPKPQK